MERKGFSDRIRNLCIRKQWFTGGGNESYDKMLSACDKYCFSTRDIAVMIYTCSDGDFNEILREVERERAAMTGNHIVLSSKDCAALSDIFSGEVMGGCKELAEALISSPLKKAPLEEAYYDGEFHQQFEMLASDLIRDAYGVTYESDGTDF